MVGFRIPFAGFRIPLAGFRIPKPLIPDSTDQNYLDSGFRITLHEAKVEKGQIPTVFLLKLTLHILAEGEFSKPQCVCILQKPAANEACSQ